MIGVAFRQSVNRSWFSRLVHLIAGRPVHCMLVLSRHGGTLTGIEATNGPGVHWRTLSPTQIDTEQWMVVDVPMCSIDTVTHFASVRVGSRYDYVGAILYGTPLTTRDRWTCSELCAEALVAGGAPLALLDAGRTPRRLWRALLSLS